MQLPGQSIPAGVLVTAPAPVPTLFTVSWMGAIVLKVAVTDVAAFREMVQVVLVPLQPPDHAAKLEPDLAAAVSLIDVPGVNFAAHVLPQLTPEGLLVTVPAPLPAFVTVSWMGEAVVLKVAVTVVAAFKETVQVALVPLQLPDHPANLEPDLAVAVSLIDVPGVNFAAHVLPQLTPEGLVVTVPAPLPALFTVSWTDVEAPAMQDIPHRPRNNTRQKKLPRKDLSVAISPPRGPYVLLKSSGLPRRGKV